MLAVDGEEGDADFADLSGFALVVKGLDGREGRVLGLRRRERKGEGEVKRREREGLTSLEKGSLRSRRSVERW